MTMERTFKKVRQVSGITAAIAACSVQAVELGTSSYVNVNDPTPSRIIVKYKESQGLLGDDALFLSTQKTAQASLLSRLSEETGETLSVLRKLHTGARVIEVEQPKTPTELKALVDRFKSDSQVEYAEPDVRYQAFMVPNDSRYSDQWSLFDSNTGIDMPNAWEVSTGENVVVAVLDTGYLPHVDLVNNLLSGYDFIADTNVSVDGDGRDADAIDPGDWASAGYCNSGDNGNNSTWHGIHVAGTIAAQTNNGFGVAGVAYDSKILPVRVLGRCGGWMSDFSDAVIWAAGGSVSGVPSNSTPAQVINMSLGGNGSCGRTMQDAVDTARSLGVTVVVAAGNDNVDAVNTQPANCSGVITVAATNDQGGRASYSNYGNNIDLAAPGGDRSYGVLSTLNSGQEGAVDDSYAYYQGTSMATPHVAGVAALLYAVKPDITPTEVENILVSSAKSFSATCNQCGSGILDANAALMALQNDGGSNDGSTGSDDNNNGDTVSGSQLQNGVAIANIQLTEGENSYYTIDVPANTGSLRLRTSGGQGDVDLYVKYNAEPTFRGSDCYSAYDGNDETCTITNPNAGTYHIMLYGYRASSGVSLTATY
ncbi:S8 family peptidase [Marinomonas transparens]|uniref:S8 family serine peptidase n=1 Tax=Marinomonas transparens TaxID=2795388 RepID=A0A934JNC4_9GAMM|nr:S8 family peptidase [Marinomonas transparens]MBJ7539415.1 S8 family serine peptidase [Marinomonas transparens]